MFTGTYTAIVTPFKNGQLDTAALERLVKAQVKGGVDGVVPVGTVPTLMPGVVSLVVGAVLVGLVTGAELSL